MDRFARIRKNPELLIDWDDAGTVFKRNRSTKSTKESRSYTKKIKVFVVLRDFFVVLREKNETHYQQDFLQSRIKACFWDHKNMRIILPASIFSALPFILMKTLIELRFVTMLLSTLNFRFLKALI